MSPETQYTSHASAAVAGGSVLGGSIVVLLNWYLSLKGVTAPPDVIVAMTTIANVVLSVVSSVLMKKFGLFSN